MSLGSDLEPFFDWMNVWMVGLQKDHPLIWLTLTVISVVIVVGFFGAAVIEMGKELKKKVKKGE